MDTEIADTAPPEVKFDLRSIATTRGKTGVPMPVLHPGTGTPIMIAEGVPLTITLLGRSSRQFQATLRSIQDERARMRREGDQITTQTMFDEDTTTLSACTVAWTFTEMDGAPFPCNKANARRLWLDPEFLFVREAALAFIVRDANFLPAASRSSNGTPDTSSASSVLSPAAEAPSPTP